MPFPFILDGHFASAGILRFIIPCGRPENAIGGRAVKSDCNWFEVEPSIAITRLNIRKDTTIFAAQSASNEHPVADSLHHTTQIRCR